ncbi:MAG: mechanosensitive ion channel domain-containing protein [archaeon]
MAQDDLLLVSPTNQLLGNTLTASIITIILLLIGFIVGRVVGVFLEKILNEMSLNKAVKNLNFRFNTEKLVSGIVSYSIYAFTIYSTFLKIGIAKATGLLLLAVIIVSVGILFFLYFKDFTQNTVAGFILRHKEKYESGEFVTIGKVSGLILKTNATNMHVKTDQGDFFVIPYVYAYENK